MKRGGAERSRTKRTCLDGGPKNRAIFYSFKSETMVNEMEIPKDFFKQFNNKEAFMSFFNDLFKKGVEQMLQGELDEHLGDNKHAKAGYNSGNSRNGTYKKKVKSEALGVWFLIYPGTVIASLNHDLSPRGSG